MIDNLEYLYIVNYPTFEKELCMMEMRRVFKKEPIKKVLFSNYFLEPSYSPFIKSCVEIIYKEKNFEDIINNIKRDKLAFDDFKVEYLRLEDWNVPYEERLNCVRSCGLYITGEPDIHNPKISIGITKVCDEWILGIHKRNNYKWHIHDRKPCTYSNSLGIRVARALINIALGNERELSMIDPCCGVGTVIIEGLSMNANIKGIEINPPIACNAKRNLEFFNLKQVIEKGNMHDIKDYYDRSIIDIPYGLFTPTTKEEQIGIITTARKISNELILIAFEDMEDMINNANFKIIDKCSVTKGKFIRYVYICN